MNELAERIGARAACRLLGAARATRHRHAHPRCAPQAKQPRRGKSPRALSASEEATILATVHSERFTDGSVREIYASLLDEGSYIGSISTIYRILRRAGETLERRRLATHPARIKPELAASEPGRVWSWDITKLLGPWKWTYYHLYVVIDIFSRYVVGWRLENHEDGTLARELFEQTIRKERVDASRLTIHADGGSAMVAKTVAQLFSDLRVTPSRSRPHVSNDNPFSEALFKTAKYGPTYPERFANIEQARAWCRTFFPWYNEQHHHSGIALLTPADVHFGRVQERRDARRAVLQQAWEARPERFVRGCPEPPALVPTVYINEPELTNIA